jgi:hypothetical protein
MSEALRLELQRAINAEAAAAKRDIEARRLQAIRDNNALFKAVAAPQNTKRDALIAEYENAVRFNQYPLALKLAYKLKTKYGWESKQLEICAKMNGLTCL